MPTDLPSQTSAPLPPVVDEATWQDALGELRVRDRAHSRRVFFPKGGAARAHVVADERPPLPGPLVSEVEGLLTAELLARAGRLPARSGITRNSRCTCARPCATGSRSTRSRK